MPPLGAYTSAQARGQDKARGDVVDQANGTRLLIFGIHHDLVPITDTRLEPQPRLIDQLTLKPES